MIGYFMMGELGNCRLVGLYDEGIWCWCIGGFGAKRMGKLLVHRSASSSPLF